MPRIRILLGVAAAAVALVVVLVVLRNDDEATVGRPTTTTTDTPPTTEGRGTRSTRGGSTQSTLPLPTPTLVRITVRSGRVVAVRRPPRIFAGRPVTLVVSADVRDEVHLHGYDRRAPVSPGSPARISFRAARLGRFDVELEERKLKLAQLDISP